MGCDGGTIPTRDELVKLKKKPEQKDADAVRLLKWAHCALSQQVSPSLKTPRSFIFNNIVETLLPGAGEKRGGSLRNGSAVQQGSSDRDAFEQGPQRVAPVGFPH